MKSITELISENTICTDEILVNEGVNEEYWTKALNMLNDVYHYGNKACPSNKKDEFKSKWEDLRKLIRSWN